MKQKSKSVTARLGKQNVLLALYALLFFIFVLIATLAGWGLSGESEDFGEGLGKAITIVFLLIVGGGCYGILGAVNGIFSLLYGRYLSRLAVEAPIRRAAFVASFVLKVLTALLTTGAGVFLSALLFSTPSALAFAVIHTIAVAVLPVWLLLLAIWELHAYRAKAPAHVQTEESM